jgi:hypothetical protein
MRLSKTLPLVLSTMLAALSAQAGVQVVMQSKIDIPGAKMKIMGKDFSQSEQRFLVDSAAELKGTVTGGRTNWVDLKREAFFDQTKRNCTVTTFAEMEERLQAMQGQESPSSFMGKQGEEPPERNPEEYEVRIDTRARASTEVAGLTGTATGVEIEVVEKKSGNVVSKIDIENVYVDSDELKLLQEFDRKMAERSVQSIGAALGMDFDAMRGNIMGHPDMRMALEKMQAAGIDQNQAVVRTETRFTMTEQAMQGRQAERAAAAEEEPEEEEPKASGFAAKMMVKMKARQAKKNANKGSDEASSGEAGPSGPQTMKFSSELVSYESGVNVTLPQECVDAYKKKIR